MTCDLLKVANGAPRVVAHAAKASLLNEQYLAEGSRWYREHIPPTRFLLEDYLRQIMLSNRNYQDPRVIAELPQEHWNALVGRGIDPIWVPTDGRDGLDLFEYTHHTATEGNMLRSLQFTWEVSRAAVQFYVEHIHALVDIHPRRLVMIAQTIRDNPDDKHRGRLGLMLRGTDQRPKFKLSQRVAMDGGLLLPKRPPPPKHSVRGAQKPVVPTRKFEVPDPPSAASQPVRGATLLVLDGVSAIEAKAGVGFEMKRFTHELQTLASTTNCTTLLLTATSGTSAAPEQTMVDGLIELRQRLYGLRNERRILVHKLRGSAYLKASTRSALPPKASGYSLGLNVSCTAHAPECSRANETTVRSSLA